MVVQRAGIEGGGPVALRRNGGRFCCELELGRNGVYNAPFGGGLSILFHKGDSLKSIFFDYGLVEIDVIRSEAYNIQERDTNVVIEGAPLVWWKSKAFLVLHVLHAAMLCH